MATKTNAFSNIYGYDEMGNPIQKGSSTAIADSTSKTNGTTRVSLPSGQNLTINPTATKYDGYEVDYSKSYIAPNTTAKSDDRYGYVGTADNTDYYMKNGGYGTLEDLYGYDEQGNPIFVQTKTTNTGKQEEKKQNQGSAGTYSSSTTDYLNSTGTSWSDDIYSTVESILKGEDTALKEALQAALDKINAQYDKSARDYYTLYKTQQNALPEYLSQLGVTGGATETAGTKLLANYGTNLSNNEYSRNSSLADTDTSYNQQISQNNQNVANSLANYYYNLKTAEHEEQVENERLEAERQAQAQQAANELAYKYYLANLQYGA